MMKSVVNIPKLSPTHFVSNIHHQKRSQLLNNDTTKKTNFGDFIESLDSYEYDDKSFIWVISYESY